MNDNRPNIFFKIFSVLAAPTLLVSIALVIWMSGTSYFEYGIIEDLIRTVSAVLCIFFLLLFTSDMIACFSDNFRRRRSLRRGRSLRLCVVELAFMMLLPVAAVFVYQALFDELTWYFDKNIIFWILAAVCLVHLCEYTCAGISILFDIIDDKQKPAPFDENDGIDLYEKKEDANE